MEVGGHRHAPADFPSGKRPGTHFAGGWKPSPQPPPPLPVRTDALYLAPPEFRPPTVQSVACRYTDHAILEKRVLA